MDELDPEKAKQVVWSALRSWKHMEANLAPDTSREKWELVADAFDFILNSASTPPPGYALVKMEGAEERVARAIAERGYRQMSPPISDEACAKYVDWCLNGPRRGVFIASAQAAIKTLTEVE